MTTLGQKFWNPFESDRSKWLECDVTDVKKESSKNKTPVAQRFPTWGARTSSGT